MSAASAPRAGCARARRNAHLRHAGVVKGHEDVCAQGAHQPVALLHKPLTE